MIQSESLEDRRLLTVLLADSFEVSEWNGVWAEDGQNDWKRSTQRESDGSYSAEVDGYASNATLSLANPIDLTTYESAELTFSWYIESGFDSGEYIALDFFDGTNWNQIASLNGNVDQENTWHNETITIDGDYLTSDFQLRFRAKVSSSREDGFVDNVKIEGAAPTLPAISINDTSVTEGDTSIEFLDAFVSAGSGGLNYPKEQAFGPDGNLYVTSGNSDSVLRYDSATGEFIDVFVPASAGLDNPQGLLFGPDGNLYVTSRLTDEVFRFNGSTGAPIDTFVTVGSGGLVNPVGLAFGDDGDLYVSSRDTDEVLRYDGATGAFIDVFVTAASGGLDYPHGLVFGPDGNLYVTSPNRDPLEEGLVLRYDGSTGAFIDVFVTAGHSTGGINDAIGVVFGPAGDLYVSRAGGNSVLRYDGSIGAYIEDYVSSGSGGLAFPGGLLFDADGNLYVSSRDTNEVLRYGAVAQAVFTVSLSSPSAVPVTVDFSTSDGTATSSSDYQATSGTITFAAGETTKTIIVSTFDDFNAEDDETFTVTLSNAVGTTIADGTGLGTIVDDDAGQLTISDAIATEGDRNLAIIDRFVPDDGVTQLFRNLVLGPDATGDGADDLYVVSSGSDEVLRFDSVSGAFIDVFVTAGAGGIDDPVDLTFGPDNELYVTSRGTNGNPDNNNILRFDGTSGDFIDVFASGLQRAISVDFGDDGNLYVGNRDTNTVQSFDGVTKQSLGSFVTDAAGTTGELRQVTFGRDLNNDGLRDLYVANEVTAEITRYDAATGSLLDSIAIPGTYGQLMWIEVGQDGSIYASVRPGTADARILRLDGDSGAILDEVALGRDGWSTHIGADNILYVGGNGGGPIIDRIAAGSMAAFDVTLASPGVLPVSVDFTTGNATATSGSDYAAVSGTIVFEPGVTSRTIIVPSIDDSNAEADETFTVTLSNPVGSTILDGTGVGTIIDDDPVTQAPLADAGADQTLSDAGGNGDEFVTLTGTGSDSDGTVASYEWTEGTTVLGTTASISPTLAVGTHTLTLTVTDNVGATATDTVVITINEVQEKPIKVFILAGQSNMGGTARVDNLDPSWNVPQDDVWIWLDHDMDGGQWSTSGPGHGLATHAPRPEEPEGLDPRNGLGPELSLGRILADAYPDHRVALIKHAEGGRDLASHFNPENIGAPESSEHMWSGLLKKTDDAFAVLDASGYTYEIEGLFLAMGGGDARNRNSNSSDPNEVLAGEQEALARSAQYGVNLTNFIAAVRDEYAENLPIIMTQIMQDISPELLETFPGAELVRQGQLDVAEALPWTEQFSTAGITLRDAVHFDATGQIELGTRFTNTYLDLVSSLAPVADDDAYVGAEDTVLNVAAPGVLDGDTDAESDPLTAAIVTQATGGVVVLNADGSFTYTPNADFNGPDSFTYTANDGTSNSNVATVNLTVTPVNDAPVANGQSLSTDEDNSVAVTLAGSDIEGDPLTFIVQNGPTSGSLSGTAPALTYTPNPGFTGADSFTFISNDGAANSAAATITIVVNEIVNVPPTANAGTDQTLSDGDGGSDALATLSGSGSDSDGTIASYQWTDETGFLGNTANISTTLGVGTHTLTLTVTDNDGATASDSMVVIVNPNQGPTANAGANQTLSDGDGSGDALATLTGSGSDSDGTIASYQWADETGVLGNTAISQTLSVGTHTLTLTVTDNGGATASDSVVVTVNPNQGPTANAGSDQIVTDGTAVTLNGSGSDADGSVVSYQWTDGTTVLGNAASISPTLAVGAHNLTLTVTDNGGATASDTVMVTVNPIVVSSTKFYVVDTSVDDMFEYKEDGTLVEDYNLGSGNNAPRGVAADITGDTVWVIDNDDYVYVHDNDGNLLRKWKASGLSRPEGIASNGTDIWIVDRGNDRVHYFAGGATRTTNTGATSSFSLVAGNPRGITTDGTHLWVVDTGTDDVYKYTTGGAFLGNWALDSRNTVPRGITIDPANVNDIWVVDSTDDSVYKYSGAASRTSGSQSAAEVFALAASNTNPQGIADPPPGNVSKSSADSSVAGDASRPLVSQRLTELPATLNTWLGHIKRESRSGLFAGPKTSEINTAFSSIETSDYVDVDSSDTEFGGWLDLLANDLVEMLNR